MARETPDTPSDGRVSLNGTLRTIWIKRAHGGVMDVAESATLVAGKGIAGNADQGRKRQITLIEEEIWEDLMKRLHAGLPTSTRRANLVVREFPLLESRGRQFTIGGCRLRIGGEVKPCNLMDSFLPGLREAMFPQWQGGAFAEVLEGGVISVGDELRWVASEAARDDTIAAVNQT